MPHPNLPNDGMNFSPFDPLAASELNDIVENIEALAAGTGLDDAVLTAAKVATGQLLRLDDNTHNYKIQFKSETRFCGTAPGDNAFTITLPTAYSNANYYVVAMLTTSTFGNKQVIHVTAKTSSNFTASIYLPDGTTATVGFDWFTIGY